MTVLSTLATGLFSASLVTAFFVAYDRSDFRAVVPGQDLAISALANLDSTVAPKQNLVMSEHVKSDGAIEQVSKKGGFAASVAYMSANSPLMQTATTDSVSEESGEFSTDINPPEIQPASLQLPEGIPAMLRRGKNGIEIGNFHAATISGDTEDCLSTAYSMLSSAHVPEDDLNIMVATKPITIAKLCASNGTIVFTCRNNSITISPRPLRPDNNCPSKS